MDRPLECRFTVRGALTPAAGAAWFEGLAVATTADGDTVVVGTLPDQASLHGVLARIRDLGLVLVTVETVEARESDRSKEV